MGHTYSNTRHGAGLFVTIEGGEGVGKTTLMERLQTYFSSTKHNFIRTREPGGTPEAEAIRNHILNPQFERPDDYQRGFMTEIFLFCAARADHVQRKIKPALEHGAIVLCDRYYDSTLAYQVAAAPEDKRDNVESTIRQLNTERFGIIKPDITFLLEAPKEVLDRRMTSRGGKLDFIEQRTSEYHERVRKNFSKIAENDYRFERINANQSRANILRDVLFCLEQRHNVTRDEIAFASLPA